METLQERDKHKRERYTPSETEELKREAIHDRYEKLSQGQRNIIDELSLVLTEAYRKRHGERFHFGVVSARELIGKLGMFLNDLDKNMSICPHCGHVHRCTEERDE